jgi:uncharacterized protein YegL
MPSAEIFPVANPDKPQAACALLLDTSRSMRGAPIRALEQGLETYREFLSKDEEAKMIVETCIISFNDEAKVVHPFSSVEQIPKVELNAGGWTSMGAAIELGIDQIEARKQYYKEEGIDYYRPFLVVITDGAPTDLKSKQRFADLQTKLQAGAKDRKFIPLLFGTNNANFDKLKELVGDSGQVAGIDGARFEEFFRWLSKSVSGIKDSRPGDTIQFEDPTKKTRDNPNPFAFEV